MPIAAMDGTMLRLEDSPARARLKKGALSDVVAVAGYMPNADGQPCVLVAIVNSDRVGMGADGPCSMRSSIGSRSWMGRRRDQ